MNANIEIERRLADFYASEAPQRAPDQVLDGALVAIDSITQRRGLIPVPWRFRRMSTSAKLAVAVMLVIAAGAIGFALAGSRPPLPVLVPWTPDRLDQDWPAPVRPEPVGGGPIVTMGLADGASWDSTRGIWDSFAHSDPVGDIAGEDIAWVDIREVGLGPGTVTGFALELADDVPRPQADPAERWIAFGIVQDTNSDGAADVRIGIDNLPVSGHRAWRTDLSSGETTSGVGPPYGRAGLDSYYPGDGDQSGNGAFLSYRLSFEELIRTYPFYAWASMIEDGRVVATDYAPDVGWLVADENQDIRLVGPVWSTDREIPSESMSFMATLRFTDDGRLLVDTDCRTGAATVVVGPDTVHVSDLTMSGGGCRTDGGNAFEAEILAVLAAGDITYSLDAGVLELRAGSNVLRLEGALEGPGG